ncbi:mycofactocin-coupled SDR family oxidoreductase [Streptosporangium sp. G11]|uniref:mycofactocin-coupled SDR family oxidoreductase n=1 Tax=Streptosporangium sp. G11 TaxID=3436926 RepID=UPI003EBA4931
MTRHLDKTVLVTGAARGIGRAVAETFAAEGADVVACDVGTPIRGAQSTTAWRDDLDRTARAVRALGRRCLVVPIDVRSQASLDEAVARGLEEFGRLDVAVANAGIMQSAQFWEIAEETWQAVLDVNLGGVWRTAKAVAPHMIERRSGVILATASVQARSARKGLAAYTASKHGLLGLMKSLALELGDHDVRVNTVLPGAVHTPMIDNDETGRLGEDSPRTAFFRKMAALRNRSALPPSAVAAAMSWLASNEAGHVTGAELQVDAGSLVLPGLNHAPVID